MSGRDGGSDHEQVAVADGRAESGIHDAVTIDRSDQATLAGPSPRATRSPAAAGKARHQAGAAFGPYRLVRMLGKGGFGQVWEAEDAANSRRLALKILTEARELSESDRQRFEREGRLAASVSHPNCVYVFGAAEIEGCPVISMELMPGGTLHDEIGRRGALPYREAVDLTLDLLEGLQAALARGVIHRDIKPSNCFKDDAGRAKIGDFGLSRTLETDGQLTASGAFVGTPCYASPEQIKAEALDFRADMYSLGATLYALLAGRPPFEGNQLGQIVAAILSEPAPPLSRPGVRVPAGLERVVHRAMAKDRQRRYASYAALRAALVPYSSQGLTAASLARRFAAYLADTLILTPLHLWLLNGGASPAWGGALEVAYFSVQEKLWSRTLGKRLFGLTVRTAEGGDLRWGQALLRSAACVFASSLGDLAKLLLFPERAEAYAAQMAAANLLGCALLLSTMRRRNGFAGLHEIASGTRVAALRETRTSASAPCEERGAAAPSALPRRFGPYLLENEVWKAGGEALLRARDPVLDRTVFVHVWASEQRPPTLAALAASGAGRLRWLQGSRQEGQAWDAYERPGGTSLVDWVEQAGRLSWDAVRELLLTLLPALRGASRESDPPSAGEGHGGPTLSLARVWVDAHGHGRLLDFAARRFSMEDDFTESEAGLFLHQLVLFALEGRVTAKRALSGRTPAVPLAGHARRAIQRIVEAPGAIGAELAAELLSPASAAASVTRGRRAVAIAFASWAPLWAVLFGITFSLKGQPLVLLKDIHSELASWRALEGKRAPDAQARRRALETVLAADYRRLEAIGHRAADDRLGYPFAPALRNDLRAMMAEDRTALERIAALTPSTTRAQLEEAERVAAVKRLDVHLFSAGVFTGALFPALLVGLPAALALRGGLGLRLGGIAVQQRDGRPASRLRCLWRALVAWSPLLAPFSFLPALLLRPSVFITAAVAAPLIALTGAVYAIAFPTRGLQDVAAGTYLVPR